MHKRVPGRLAFLVALVVLLFSTTACSCGNIIQRAAGPLVPSGEPTAPAPTLPRPLPSATAPASSEIPEEPGQEFTVELTEDEVNELLVGNAFEQAGATVEDVQVAITPEKIIATFRVTQPERNLSVEMTARGVLLAHDGQAHLRVDDFELDRSVPGLVRAVASAAVERVIKDYSTPYGIPIPTDRFEVLDIQQEQGMVRLTGRTR